MYKWIQKKHKKINKGDSLIDKLCNVKGIKKEDVDEFLTPTEKSLVPAEDLKNGEEASERIINAINNDEKIVVSADNDADGVTSTAIIVRYLSQRLDYQVPYIFAERNWGHGIKEQLKEVSDTEENKGRNKNAKKNRDWVRQADLLIIVDSSSNDVDTVEEVINEYETDVVILDHHDINKADKKMADVGAILVNPRQRGCRYMNKNISGAGVVYKIVGLVEKMIGDGLIDTEQYIDLAGVGIICLC